MEKKLQITATAKVQQASSELKKLQSVLTGTGEVITRVGNIFDKNGNRISKTIVSTEQHGNKLYRTIKRIDQNGVLRNLSTSITDVSDKVDKTANIFSKWKNVLSFTAVIAGVKALSKAVFETTTKAIDYSESLNLFNVVFKNIEENGETTFSKVGKEATEFQEKLQRNFGANRTESMYFQGLYQSMASSQGIAEEYANIMSENSTKLTYDLSSLFNANQADTAEALRAGIYAGQTKPLRSYGIDITENTLQATLDKMKETNSALDGLSVSSMSQAEKQILRYISVLEQASVAHGDFANTINSPANQLKILQNQFIEMSVSIGNLFLGPLQKFLTFANTIVIVIKQVANAIASLFGIETEDYNTGIASVGGMSEAYDELGNSADKANGKVSKLKRQVLGFDQINNISEPTNGGSGGNGGGAYNGINQALLDSLKGYDNGLDKVRVKAQAIADNIMKWIGFTYDAEEGVWKFGKAYDNLITSSKMLSVAFDVLGNYSFTNLENLYNNFLKPVAKWTLGAGLPKFVEVTANGILKTDWENLNQKLNNFYKSLTPFSINVGEGLLWFYEEVLVPIGSFAIGQAVPEFVDMLTNGLTILNNTIDVIEPAIDFIWDGFLKPIGSWTGGIAVDVLKDINSVLNLIGKSKVASTITALSTAFLLVKSSGITFNSVLNKILKSSNSTADALSSTKQNGLGKIISMLTSKFKAFLTPTAKLVSSIKGASAEAGKFAKATKNSSTILGVLKSKVTETSESIKKFAEKIKTTENPLKKLGTNVKKGLGNAFKNAQDKINNFNNQLSNGIKTWYNTTTAADKLKTGLTGLGTSIVSIQGITNAMKDMSTEGANFGNVSATVVSGLGAITSAAMTGASVGGIHGAVIGGIVGAIGSLVSVMTGLNGVSGEGKVIIDDLNNSYSSFKENLNSTIETYSQSIEQAQNSILVKETEVSKAKELASTMTDFIDINGRVKTGYEERANVILTQLNGALGTQFSLEQGVIKNGAEIISSKERFIEVVSASAEAIQKETLLQSYQAQYKAAIDAQIEAKRIYNQEIANETAAMEEALAKYEKNKISAADLGKAVQTASDNKQKAEKKYNKVLEETGIVVDGLEDVVKAYADGSVKDLKDAMTQIDKSNNNTTENLEKDWNSAGKKINEVLKSARKEAQKDIESTIKVKFEDREFRQKQRKFANDYNNSMKNSGGVLGPNFIGPMPTYANGGFPEEGPFYMNRGEIAGKFGNGKSVVANNQQITDGIKYAVMDGMSEVMRIYGGGTSNIRLDITTEEGVIVKKAVDGINRITETTGECPIAVV